MIVLCKTAYYCCSTARQRPVTVVQHIVGVDAAQVCCLHHTLLVLHLNVFSAGSYLMLNCSPGALYRHRTRLIVQMF